jgi:hypothetical protein
LAAAGDWITFLFESQRGGYPPDIPLQVARSQFADPAVGAHLVLVLAQLAKTNPRGSTEVPSPPSRPNPSISPPPLTTY